MIFPVLFSYPVVGEQMEKLFLGIDGGQTKIRGQIICESGRIIAEKEIAGMPSELFCRKAKTSPGNRSLSLCRIQNRV